MPIPAAILPALISAGGAAVGQGIGAISQGSVNKKTRKWNEKMYGIQRNDALADYHMQNQYNSPREQMARLRDAGLNPHLVYGNGADAQGGIVRQSSVESWNPRAPEFDMGQVANAGISAYFDSRIKEAQTDNLMEMNKNLEAERMLKLAQISQTLTGTKRAQFDLELAQEIREYSVDAAKLANERTEADISSTRTGTAVLINRDEREAAMNASNIKEAIERILTMRKQRAKTDVEIKHINQQIENLKNDNEMKKIEIEMARNGVFRGDSIWWRAIIAGLQNQTVGGIDLNPSGAIKRAIEQGKKYAEEKNRR